MKIQIIKNVPIPTRRSGSTYPFSEMEVGDMFELKYDRVIQMSLYSASRSFVKRNKLNWKFLVTANKNNDYIKVWRTK